MDAEKEKKRNKTDHYVEEFAFISLERCFKPLHFLFVTFWDFWTLALRIESRFHFSGKLHSLPSSEPPGQDSSSTVVEGTTLTSTGNVATNGSYPQARQRFWCLRTKSMGKV